VSLLDSPEWFAVGFYLGGVFGAVVMMCIATGRGLD